MIVVFFHVWEDARVWAHWNYSLDTHLHYLGPVSYFSPSWVPSGRNVRGSCSGQLLDAHNILCLLKWQATFFVHTLHNVHWRQVAGWDSNSVKPETPCWMAHWTRFHIKLQISASPSGKNRGSTALGCVLSWQQLAESLLPTRGS